MKKFKHLTNGEIEFNGIVYPRMEVKFKDIQFNFEKWLKHWNKIIEEIKKMKLDYGQIENIHTDFIHDMLMYMRENNFKKKLQEFGELSTKLKIAYYQAYTNYRDTRGKIWAFFAGLFTDRLIDKLNIPSIPLNKKQ